jgi:RNA polymerase sigma factor for flagellar operon FliA
MDSPDPPEHLQLVRNCAKRLARELRLADIELDELVSLGWVGFRESQKRFEPARGVPLEAYVYPRVRGAMLDGVINLARFTRKVHAARRLAKMDAALDAPEPEKKKPVDEDDASVMAEAFDAEVGVLAMSIGLSAYAEEQSERSSENAQVRRLDLMKIEPAVRWLPQRERSVIEGLYFQGITLEEIAGPLRISKSDAGRAHLNALKLLRKRFSS